MDDERTLGEVLRACFGDEGVTRDVWEDNPEFRHVWLDDVARCFTNRVAGEAVDGVLSLKRLIDVLNGVRKESGWE